MKIKVRDEVALQQKILLCMALFCFTNSVHAFLGKTFLQNRSQSNNSARLWAGFPLVSVIEEQARARSEDVVYAFEVVPEYTRTFKSDKIAQYFFGSQNVVVSGSRSGNRGPNDILADYLGLPSDYRSTLNFCPVIKNFLVDFYWRADFGCFAEGLSLTIHAPIVYTQWNLNLQETIASAGTNFSPAGYFGSTRITRSELVPSAASFFAGGNVFGDMQSPLKYGLIPQCRKTKVRLSDIQAFLQWDFVNQEDCKVGFEIFGSAPAGNRPEGCFLFEPIVGNGKHWELGAGLNGYLTLWESQKCNRVGGFFGQLLVSHLFKADQRRSFDFINNGPGSRYMLLEEIRTLVCGLQIPAGVTPPNQYQGVLVTAINKTTLPCSISVPAQVDLLLKLNMRAGGFDAEVGYNLWFRMAERLNCRKRFKENKYGVKGDAQIYGFALPNPPGSPVPLNATQHNATLHAGQGVGNASFTNANADNAANAFDTVSGNLDNLTAADAIASGVGLADANSSNPAILLTDSDIDNCSALSPKAISHKFFVHAGYAGKELNNCWIPYFGIGAEAEISCFCFTTNSAVSQWGVWIKGGLSY